MTVLSFTKNFGSHLVTIAATVMLTWNGASAAPQILAVAASQQPIPFVCHAGVCEVEVSAMCLQEKRRYPDTQTVYSPHDRQSFVLVIRDADGKERRRVVDDTVTIRSKRTFTAVRFSLNEGLLKGSGGTEVALAIAEEASLVPEAVEGDRYPQTPTDIALATETLGQIAAGWLDTEDEGRVASRLVNAVLNNLPRQSSIDAATYRSAWEHVENRSTEELGEDAVRRAQSVYEHCDKAAVSGQYRHCLEKVHDAALYRMNIEYWRAIKTGS